MRCRAFCAPAAGHVRTWRRPQNSRAHPGIVLSPTNNNTHAPVSHPSPQNHPTPFTWPAAAAPASRLCLSVCLSVSPSPSRPFPSAPPCPHAAKHESRHHKCTRAKCTRDNQTTPAAARRKQRTRTSPPRPSSRLVPICRCLRVCKPAARISQRLPTVGKPQLSALLIDGRDRFWVALHLGGLHTLAGTVVPSQPRGLQHRLRPKLTRPAGRPGQDQTDMRAPGQAPCALGPGFPAGHRRRLARATGSAVAAAPGRSDRRGCHSGLEVPWQCPCPLKSS